MLSASIVTYHNPRHEVEAVLECVMRSPIDKLYLIDNSRTDALRILEGRSAKITYIFGHGNVGYGSAHNIAIREAIRIGAKYHIVLNPDIWFESQTVDELVRYMDGHEDVGQVMPKVIYPDGQIQYLCKLLPSPADLILRRFMPENWFRKSRMRFELRHTGYDHVMNVPFLSGCFMFLRVETLAKVGGFDDNFFMYCEDKRSRIVAYYTLLQKLTPHHFLCCKRIFTKILQHNGKTYFQQS